MPWLVCPLPLTQLEGEQILTRKVEDGREDGHEREVLGGPNGVLHVLQHHVLDVLHVQFATLCALWLCERELALRRGEPPHELGEIRVATLQIASGELNRKSLSPCFLSTSSLPLSLSLYIYIYIYIWVLGMSSVAAACHKRELSKRCVKARDDDVLPPTVTTAPPGTLDSNSHVPFQYGRWRFAAP